RKGHSQRNLNGCFLLLSISFLVALLRVLVAFLRVLCVKFIKLYVKGHYNGFIGYHHDLQMFKVYGVTIVFRNLVKS
ncbi:MAG: hypothetical protein ACKOGP_01840, partial [Bacteroidota bacterium]